MLSCYRFEIIIIKPRSFTSSSTIWRLFVLFFLNILTLKFYFVGKYNAFHFSYRITYLSPSYFSSTFFFSFFFINSRRIFGIIRHFIWSLSDIVSGHNNHFTLNCLDNRQKILFQITHFNTLIFTLDFIYLFLFILMKHVNDRDTRSFLFFHKMKTTRFAYSSSFTSTKYGCMPISHYNLF